MRPDHTVGDQPHAGLPAPRRGFGVGIQNVAGSQPGKALYVGAKLMHQRQAQPLDIAAPCSSDQEICHVVCSRFIPI